jgi:TatD DNase family protein
MKLFDSHCHLDDEAFSRDLAGVVERARRAGVRHMTTIGVNRPTSLRAVALAEQFAGVYAAVGYHPHDASACSEAGLEELATLAGRPPVRAWGEIGLDFNRMHAPAAVQEKWFVRQLALSERLSLPVVLHERDSGGRLIDILRSDFSAGRTGVVHCFSGTAAELAAYLDLGLCIGVTGIVTMKKRGAPLRELVRRIPEDRLLIETDAPYLVPSPQRNKTRRNEPALVASVLNTLAEVRQDSPARLARATCENARRLFAIDDRPKTGYSFAEDR